jgi:predicted ATP-grasp superfamily ATP-dependent carboligase
VPIPHTQLVDGISRLNGVIDDIRYPAVIKPVRSAGEKAGDARRANAYYAMSATDVWRLYREHEHLAARPSLIQERIVGPGEGVFVLFDRGRLCAAFAHRRLREKPPSGGVSVLSESVAVDPQLLDYASRLLAPLDWHGVAMVEFKRDCRTGRGVLMEVNGRFWGSLQLAVDSGVDFPYLAWRLALGRGVDSPERYELGVRSRWLLGDLDHLLSRLFGSDRALHLPGQSPSRFRALLEFLKRPGPRLHGDVIRADDPRPALREVRHYLGALGAGAMARCGSYISGRTLYAAPNSSVVHSQVREPGR